MSCCLFPRPLVYRTIRGPVWTRRYRRCANCGSTSKTIQRGFVDERNWLERDDSLLDGLILIDGLRSIGAGDESSTRQEEMR